MPTLARQNDDAVALNERAARRQVLSRGSDPATAGIFGIIEQLDREADDHNARMLTETAIATPDHFRGNVIEALFDLCETEQCKADPALTALAAAGTDGGRLCRVALAGVHEAFDPLLRARLSPRVWRRYTGSLCQRP